MRLRTSLFCVYTFAVVLSACSLTPKEPVKIPEIRAVNAEEIASFTPSEMLLMSKTSKIENVAYTDIDGDGTKEAFMVFNSAGCSETDKARLVVLKYAVTQDMWVHFDTFILAGKQGRIESFSETPSDVTGDGKVDVEIASETNGCKGPGTLHKQLLTLRDGTLVDLTQKSIFSLEGGYGMIRHLGKTYEIYGRVGSEGQCNPYSISVRTFNGQSFIEEKNLTTTYKYKTKFDLTNTPQPDSFSADGCVMVYNDNDKKMNYIRDDAVNHVYPAVTQQK